MDLIYTDESRTDIGVLPGYKLDLAFGSGENDFEITLNENLLHENYYIYIENTEYGGIVDRVEVDTKSKEIKYYGRTWHGILNSKIIEPDAGQDYYTVSGDINTVLSDLVVRLGLAGLFEVEAAPSGAVLSNYRLDRYVSCYNGILKMLRSVGYKLHMEFRDGMVAIAAVPSVDYTQIDEFDGSQINLKVSKNYTPINHVICLGKGDLSARTVIHLYADSDGNISHTQTQFGLSEVAVKYDNSNAESIDELEAGGRQIIIDSQKSESIAMTLEPTINYDIGDIVGAREYITGVNAVSAIAKKIVAIESGEAKIRYEVGG